MQCFIFKIMLVSISHLYKYLQEDEPSTDDLEVDYDFFEQQIWPELAHRAPAFENLKVCLNSFIEIITLILEVCLKIAFKSNVLTLFK